MKVLLMCPECEYRAGSLSEKGLLNKIIMWNHVKRAHPAAAERIMRMYKTMPADLWGARAMGQTLVLE
ncbi:MAG: hypothetical protein Q7S26_04245 [bacterium]|nr:hypothetical protein [bacterium]